MANCREIEEKLAEYVDGQQAETERAAVESHLESCPPVPDPRRRRARRPRLDLRAPRHAARHRAEPSPRALCGAAAGPAAPPAAVLARTPWVRFSLAASVLLAGALFVLFGWGSSVETYAAQLSADHLKCFQYPPEATLRPRRHPARADVAGEQRLGAEGRQRDDDGRADPARHPEVRIIPGTCRAYPLSDGTVSRCRCTCSITASTTAPPLHTITMSPGSASMRSSGRSTTGPTR